VGGHTHRLSDVWRRPARLPEMLVPPVGALGDKLRLMGLRRRCLSGDLEALYGPPETTVREMLREMRFSDRIVERFFKPFFSGVFFDPALRPGPCTPGRPRTGRAGSRRGWRGGRSG